MFFGTGMGGSTTTDEGYATLYRDGSDRIKPFTVLTAMNNAASAWIGLEHGLTGPNITYSTACSSSAVAVGEAWLRVRAGAAPLALAGGAEAPLTLGTLKAGIAQTLATEDPLDPAAPCKLQATAAGPCSGCGRRRARGVAARATARRGHFGELVATGRHRQRAHPRPSIDGQARAMSSRSVGASRLPKSATSMRTARDRGERRSRDGRDQAFSSAREEASVS